MTEYLTSEQILFLHARIIAETGGSHGVRDVGMLRSAVGRSQATFDGEDLYPSIYIKAAALLESLIGNHPFLDGNKRTGITAAGIFLRLNGYQLVADNNQLEIFTLQCAKGLVSLYEAAAWFQNHSKQI